MGRRRVRRRRHWRSERRRRHRMNPQIKIYNLILNPQLKTYNLIKKRGGRESKSLPFLVPETEAVEGRGLDRRGNGTVGSVTCRDGDGAGGGGGRGASDVDCIGGGGGRGVSGVDYTGRGGGITGVAGGG